MRVTLVLEFPAIYCHLDGGDCAPLFAVFFILAQQILFVQAQNQLNLPIVQFCMEFEVKLIIYRETTSAARLKKHLSFAGTWLIF